MTSRDATLSGRFFISLATFIFILAESEAIMVVHRAPHPFAFPSQLSPYWLPVVAILPGLIGLMGIRSITPRDETKLDPTTRAAFVKWLSFGVMFAYVLFGYTINTIQVMTAHW